MARILFAWVGITDLRAVNEGDKVGLGPIAQLLVKEQFDRAVLFDNYKGERDVTGYADWLRPQTAVAIEVLKVELSVPTDLGAIYLLAENIVDKKLKDYQGRNTPCFHLSPGTPSMAAAWILLGKGRFVGAELWQTSREKGVERANIPFDIATEFAPALAKAADERLLQISAALPPDAPEFDEIIHRCTEMKNVITQARMIATRNVPVLIEGETGTGKELLARAIHKSSPRTEGPFVAVNCGAIPKDLFESEFFGHKKGAFTGADSDRKGYFESAHGGTLFLDEIGELPLDAQVKILRVLQEGAVRRIGDSKEQPADVRIVSATNRTLVEEVAADRFRADLFYRLAVAILRLPPLRQRKGDIGLLVDMILVQVNKALRPSLGYKDKKISAKAKNLIFGHGWPGNIRELQNTLTRICAISVKDTIDEEDVRQAILPSTSKMKDDILTRPLGGGFNVQELQAFLSAHYIRRALDESGGNKSKAATLLGLKNYQTLTNWAKKYDVKI